MIRLALVIWLLECSLALAQSSPAIVAAKPLVEAWRTCALEKGRTFMRSGEPAETIARVALYECRNERQVVADALYPAMSGTAAIASIEQMENTIRDLIVSIIVQAKSK